MCMFKTDRHIVQHTTRYTRTITEGDEYPRSAALTTNGSNSREFLEKCLKKSCTFSLCNADRYQERNLNAPQTFMWYMRN